MKETDNIELYECKECGEIFYTKNKLTRHIGKEHNKMNYYDKHLKKEGEGICKICNLPTKFIDHHIGYNACCCKKHSLQYAMINLHNKCEERYGNGNPMKTPKFIEKRRDNNLIKYGVNHPMKLEKNISKLKNTNMIKYGCYNPLQNSIVNEKTTSTNIFKYGVEHHMKSSVVKNKKDNTNMIKYGCYNVLQNKNIIDNIKKNNMIKYGVEHHMQVECIFDKQQSNSMKYINYKKTDLVYQSSYEFDFLEKYYDLFKNEIRRGPSIRYFFDDKNKIYFSDFYIPSLNLVVEIKNIFLYNKDNDKIKCKEEYTKKDGFNYILILEKKYDEFNLLLNSIKK